MQINITMKRISDTEIKNWHKAMLQMMKNKFIKHGNITPVFLYLELKGDKIEPGALDISNAIAFGDDGKASLSEYIKEFCIKREVVAVMIITEAWLVRRKKEELGEFLKGTKRATTEPDRKEVVFASFETAFVNKFNEFEIIRENGKAHLIEKKEKSPLMPHEGGRFMNLLSKRVIEN